VYKAVNRICKLYVSKS